MLLDIEKETIIRFDKGGPECTIWTADKSVIRKLDKLYHCKKVANCGGETSKTYLVDKKLISFRKDKSAQENKRKLSQEHIEKLRAGRSKNHTE